MHAQVAHHEEISVHDQISVFRQSPEKVVGSGYPVLLLLELEHLWESGSRGHTNSRGNGHMEYFGGW